ncbi:DUF7159 family protein [Mycobacterium sp.]|uniref:DUF7159 family protein n=1 Tax=Mycobacterium sp. TaxID=1785 RepID=UPI003CC58F9F
MDIVLGLSLAPSAIRMVLVEGENADGVTVDEDHFAVNAGSRRAALSGPDQLIAAVLGTREGAAEAGYRLTSTGVTWTDPRDAAALATALAARKIENVMLVSGFLAAAALAQTVGDAIGYEYIAMLFVERHTATIAVIDSADGSVNDVHRRSLRSANPVPELIAMIAGLNDPEAYPEGLFIVGCDVDIAPIKPALEAASLLPVSAPEEPDMALARGAALASASAPLFASSTAAVAYAQDPGTGAIDRYAVSPGYLAAPGRPIDSEFGNADFAYSAAHDEQADAHTGAVDIAYIANTATAHELAASPRRRPLLLVGSALAAIVVSAALALEIALALGIRPAVALRPSPGRVLVAPAQQAPSPPVPQLLPAPHPQTVQLPGRIAAPPAAHMPAPAPIAAVAPVPVPIPAAPVPVPVPVPLHLGIPAPSFHVPFGQFGQLPRLGIPQPPPQGSPWQPPSQGSPWQGPMHERSEGPMREPFAQGREPFPPQRGFAPHPRMNVPAPEGPRFPGMPAPEGPRFPAPMFPRMPGPMGPQMPAVPHFSFPFPRFRF